MTSSNYEYEIVFSATSCKLASAKLQTSYSIVLLWFFYESLIQYTPAQQYGAKIQTVGRETFFQSGNIRVGLHNATKNGNSWQYVYNYTDHLGNIRLAYADGNNDGTITQNEIIKESNYYPFGLKHKGYNEFVSSLGNSVANRWGYNGKENNDEAGLEWLDFGARNYDAALGRWMNLDPLAEQMRRHSPYSYAFDNPIYFIDPDGMMPLDHMGLDDNKTIGIGTMDELDGKSLDKDLYSITGLPTKHTSNPDNDKDDNNCCGGNVGLTNKVIGTTLADGSTLAMGHNDVSLLNTNNSESQAGLLGDGDYTTAETVLGVGSILYGAGELAVYNKEWGYWLGKNGKFNSISWQGNGATGGRSAALLASKHWKLAGKGVFFVGATLSFVDGVNSLSDGNYESAAKSGVDIIMGRVGFLGPWCAAASGAYFGFGWLTDNGYISHSEYKRDWTKTCFVAGTKVLMANGNSKNIEDIAPGDKILSVNIDSMSIEIDEVLIVPDHPPFFRTGFDLI